TPCAPDHRIDHERDGREKFGRISSTCDGGGLRNALIARSPGGCTPRYSAPPAALPHPARRPDVPHEIYRRAAVLCCTDPVCPMTDDLRLHGALIGRPEARAQLNTPVLVIDRDALDRNLARMAEFARGRGVALRPHAKTHKSVDLARRQIAAGAV